MKSLIKTNIRLTDKIVISAMMMVLTMVLQKIAAVNYIAVIPFLRISFGGPALIILSSIWLGPIYGLFVGAGSDVLGYFILDPKNNTFFPQITAIYALLGFSAYFIFKLVKSVKSHKLMFGIEIGTISALLAVISVYLLCNKEIELYSSTYDLEWWHKLLIISGLVILFGFIIVFTYVYFKKTKEKYENNTFNIYQISFASLILEVFVMLIFGSVMKGLAFGFSTFPAIVLCQSMVLFINIAINIVFLGIFLNIVENRI